MGDGMAILSWVYILQNFFLIIELYEKMNELSEIKMKIRKN